MGLSNYLYFPIGASPYQLVYDKESNLIIELEHKALWILKKLKLELHDTATLRLSKVNELDDFWLRSYYSLSIYKESMKLYDD